MARVAAVHVEVVAVDRGLWCPGCALSTGGRVVFVLHYPSGRMIAGRVQRCSHCGEQIPEGA